ncbi:Stress response protein nst1 [Gryganskiella cystojenkinii]|nr:Stress response protein nst1 [Gryganskiella cystojenkinii]
MAAHTFAPEDALPPPKSAVIYSRDGRKRSLGNIDMTKHLAPSHQSQPPTPLLPLSVNAPPSVAAAVSAAAAGSSTASHAHAHPGDPSSLYAIAGGNQAQSNSNGASSNNVGGLNAPQRKKKKKRSKKKTLGRIEESTATSRSTGGLGNNSSNTTAGFEDHNQQEHHAGCKHDHHQHDHHHRHHHHHDSGHHHHHEDEDDEDDEDFFSDEETYAAAADGSEDHRYEDAQSTGATATASGAGDQSNELKKKRKKRKKSSATVPPMSHHNHHHSHSHSHANGSSSKAMVSPQSSHRNGHDHGSMTKHMHDGHTQNDGFWHYSDAEERQRIREFWFQLREEERRSLVRVEKEAVLKKMKEQQRHSCSCSLCGRKRTAIEEELELLYDAYYDELEQYANQQQPTDGHVLPYSQHSAQFEDDDLSDESRASDEEDEDEDDEDDEDDDEEGYEDDDEDDEEYEDDISNRKTFPYSNGFPNALQAKGNILTVAEDLLENDGKKFLEMMDRLADRKVQRDDELMDNRGAYEEYDDEEEGEFEDEGPEEDALTKEQRMEEGRRMFQAFAARMFEQRVLSAYREKVAQERQERLLAELEEESRQEQLREERKEREKEKKRDKKRLQRQQKEEERAAKEAARLAEERRLLEEKERKLEADRKRREEERKAKEEEKRLREEERVKKEEERKRKLKEEKARETEKERKRKEEQQAKEQEDLARKELAAREKAARQEREAQLKQQLADEQRRQEDLRRQEQLAQEEAALLEASETQEQDLPEISSTPPTNILSQSPGRERTVTAGSDSSTQISATLSPVSPPVVATIPTNVHPQIVQGQMAGHGWLNSYPNQQSVPPQHFQLSHSHMHQQHHQSFPQPMQQGLFRPSNQFGQLGGDQDAFSTRGGPNAGRGPFMGGATHHNQTIFSAMNQHQGPSTPAGGLRSPGIAPVGYGAPGVSGKQLASLMSPGSTNAHDLSSSSGSPLHSPSTLGSFGPISPIGHSRRTSTPHGSNVDSIKPIQRPVPIGRPKDTNVLSNSFDGLNLGLSALTIGSDMERRSRSPPRSIGGGPLESLEGVALRKDSLRSSVGSSESHSTLFSSETLPSSRQLDVSSQPSPSIRGPRDTSFFNTFFGSRGNAHDPFFQGNDFSNYGQQQQGHGSLPNAHFMSGYPMQMPASPLLQHQQAQQQQLFLQQQQQFMHPSMQELQLQQQQQQLGLNSPPLNGSSTWGRTGFMQPPLMNGLSSSGGVSLGLTSPPSRTLSPPPLGLHNGSHSPLMPIGPPSSSNNASGGTGSSGHVNQYNNFGGSSTNGLGLTVGSGRKSVSHLPPMRNEGTESSPNGGLMGTGFPPGYGAHSLQHHQQQHHQQQQQQQHHAHRLGAIGEVGGPREGNFSL